MKKLHKFSQFLNEKAETGGIKEAEKDAKKIASEMFDKTKNIQFEYKDGKPSVIIFEVTEVDYKLDYDQKLQMDYSENVLKKRTYKVELKFKKKYTEKVSDKVTKFFMKFKVKLTPSKNVKFDVESDYYLVWGFDEKPTEVIAEIKKQKQSCTFTGGSLKILKSSWDKLSTAKVSRMIKKLDGIKKRNEDV